MIRSMEEFRSAFHAARCVSTPLVAVRTADPASTTHFIIETLKQGRKLPPLLGWDVVRGLYAIGKDSGDELARLLGERQAATIGPVDALFLAQQLCDDGILLYSNGHRFWNDPGVMQGIWDLRDPFKATGRMLVLLVAPGATLPAELGQDVLILDEPLPSTTHLEQIVRETFNAAELHEPERSVIDRAVDALVGLAAFPAEQALAMSLVKRELDTADLWERKRQIIEQTPGLSVWRGGETFEDIGGVQNVKDFLLAVLAGIEPPRVVVFIDEIEKAFAGTGTDLSGVKTEMTGTILTYMQDREADGLVFVGPAGALRAQPQRPRAVRREFPRLLSTCRPWRVRWWVLRPNGCARRSKSLTRFRKGGCCSLRLAIPSRACHPNCVGASRWARSSSTCPRPRSARRSGKSISRSTACRASYRTTKAGRARKSKSAAGRRTGWE